MWYMIMNGESEGICKEAVLAFIKLLSHHSPGMTWKNHKN